MLVNRYLDAQPARIVAQDSQRVSFLRLKERGSRPRPKDDRVPSDPIAHGVCDVRIAERRDYAAYEAGIDQGRVGQQYGERGVAIGYCGVGQRE